MCAAAALAGCASNDPAKFTEEPRVLGASQARGLQVSPTACAITFLNVGPEVVWNGVGPNGEKPAPSVPATPAFVEIVTRGQRGAAIRLILHGDAMGPSGHASLEINVDGRRHRISIPVTPDDAPVNIDLDEQTSATSDSTPITLTVTLPKPAAATDSARLGFDSLEVALTGPPDCAKVAPPPHD